jgi:hypothetical protein
MLASKAGVYPSEAHYGTLQVYSLSPSLFIESNHAREKVLTDAVTIRSVTLSIMTPSLTTLGIMTLSKDTKHNGFKYSNTHQANRALSSTRWHYQSEV